MKWVVNYKSDGSDDTDTDPVDDPFVFVWKKFWSDDRDMIKIAIMCSDKNAQSSFDGMKQLILRKQEQNFMRDYINQINEQWPRK